ncbi:NeuD/PglB/VioB family sugar acetyltransferase [Tissierella sp.]|uniref:NeuD/PglB/VioB family sugar acetyltransferase n=1 Tax=Tissierella sp. TaxID=41274 RepID=UPI003054D5BD
MKDLIIIGAGKFGRELLSYAIDIVEAGGCEWRIKGFINDDLHSLDQYNIEYPILGPIAGHTIQENAVYICAIGDSEARLSLGKEFQKKGAEFINFIHPTVRIRERVKMGVGNIFCPCAGMSTDVTIGDFVLFNSYAIVAHDCIIGSGCTLSGGCEITGNCTLGEGVFLGTKSVIVPDRKIGDYAKISAGAIVFTNVKPGKIMIGNPAMVLK